MLTVFFLLLTRKKKLSKTFVSSTRVNIKVTTENKEIGDNFGHRSISYYVCFDTIQYTIHDPRVELNIIDY